MAVPRSRVLELMKVQCRIFNTTFNPTCARLGNKILRERLKGPSLSAYYPRKMATFGQLQKLYPDWIMYDEAEEDRKEHIIALKARGKSAPKKKQSVAESRKRTGKKK